MRLTGGVAAIVAATCLARPSAADDDMASSRPAISFNRWQEDWSALADRGQKSVPFDALKYIPLAADDAASYLSLGLNLRERYEINDAPQFGVGHNRDQHYLLQRVQAHADLRPDADWQAFVQIENDVAPGKAPATAVDKSPPDIRQAFVAWNTGLGDGDLRIRIGRQEMAFDLQRFVSVRDGPNVRQAYDAVWVNWTDDPWRLIAFWSQPVQYRDGQAFDDVSNSHLRYGGFRVERKEVGPGSLTAYYSRYDADNAHFLDATGAERRNNFDFRYAGTWRGFDWDAEEMTQSGHVGDKTVLAWAVGSRAGYTVSGLSWAPRLGLQADAASGDGHPGNGRLGTFNPLFPNGYYVTLAGYTGYTNFVHIKPSVTIRPVPKIGVTLAGGLQWRETVEDAVYVQPNVAVANTAGRGDAWSGAYEQSRLDWAMTKNLAGAIEAVHFQVGDNVRRAGGRDSNYLGVEMRFGW